MDAAISYKTKSKSGLEEVRIGDRDDIGRVRFGPEIKGPEDIEALIRSKEAMSPKDPILISGHRAQNIRTQPRFKQHEEEVRDLFTSRPVLYYEPNELFRYRRPQQLVTYAFQGDVPAIKDFYSTIRDDDHRQAVSKLPRFVQPFIQAQYDSLLQSKDNLPEADHGLATTDRLHEAWTEDRVDEGYPAFISNVIAEAERSPDSVIVPPVPPILKSSSESTIRRTVGYNDLVWETAKNAFDDPSVGTVTAYLHFYIDKGVFTANTQNDRRVLNAIRTQLRKRSYAGVAITISNYERVWESSLGRRLARFMDDLDVITNEHSVPLIAPRSGYYGMYLTDNGVDVFSSLMNGNLELNRKGGAPPTEAKYGKIPVYDDCRNYSIDEATNILRRRGNLYDVPGLPRRPPVFDQQAESVKAIFGKPKHFRVEFGKQRRLLHVKEAEEIRKAIVRGTANPATEYFRGSKHPHLS